MNSQDYFDFLTAFFNGTPNAEGESTHDLHAGGAFADPRNRRIPDYQCGMDWREDRIEVVVDAFDDFESIDSRPWS